MARSRGNDTATTRSRLAGMFTSITVSEREPPASSVVPDAHVAGSRRMRLSTPTIKKFSSPNCAFGSTMSRESGSSAEIRLSMLFFADCHCHAPPVMAKRQHGDQGGDCAAGDHRPAAPPVRSGCSVRRDLGADVRRRHPAAPADQGQIRQLGGRAPTPPGSPRCRGCRRRRELDGSLEAGAGTASMISVGGAGGGGGAGSGR